jgi:hypothetical protein
MLKSYSYNWQPFCSKNYYMMKILGASIIKADRKNVFRGALAQVIFGFVAAILLII